MSTGGETTTRSESGETTMLIDSLESKINELDRLISDKVGKAFIKRGQYAQQKKK